MLGHPRQSRLRLLLGNSIGGIIKISRNKKRMTKPKFTFMELPISQVARDPNQPRKDFGAEGEKNKLKLSIKNYGIEEPIKVSEVSPKRYIIIDGHRRYICAQKLNMKYVPCRIYPKMTDGEFETRRYEMQNNRRAWNSLERSEALERIKYSYGFKNNHELADYLGMSRSSVQLAMQMRKQRISNLTMMERYSVPKSVRMSMLNLFKKLRKIKKLEVDDITAIIFEKIEKKVIKKSLDIRKIGKAFMQATINEDEIHQFLTKPDMTANELEQRTRQTGFALMCGDLIKKITQKKENGTSYTKNEKASLVQLESLIRKTIKVA